MGSVAAYNLAELLRLGLLFFLPAFFFVIGQDTAALGRLGLLDAEKRAEYRIVVKRMLIWFVSAGISGVVASTILNDVFVN